MREGHALVTSLRQQGAKEGSQPSLVSILVDSRGRVILAAPLRDTITCHSEAFSRTRQPEMDAVSAASAIAGLISLSIALLDGCVRGFVLLAAAQGVGREVDQLRAMLDFETWRLYSWANTVGLLRTPPHFTLNANVYGPVVTTILEQLGQLLTDTSKLKLDYGLNVAVTDEEIKDLAAEKSLFDRFFNRNQPRFRNDSANVFRRRIKPWKKLKWVAIDRDGSRLLLGDVKYWVDNLESLLGRSDQEHNSSQIRSTVRAAVAETTDPSDLAAITQAEQSSSMLRLVAASARLRNEALLLNVFDEAQSKGGNKSRNLSQTTLVPDSRDYGRRKTSPGPSKLGGSLKKDFNLLLLSTDCKAPTNARSYGTYDGHPVIVEWKSVEVREEPRLKHRIERVAALLQNMNHPSFHSLQCLGYLRDPSTGRYAYLYSFPNTIGPKLARLSMSSGTTLPQFDEISSLVDLLKRPGFRPSLSVRLRIGIALVETVLQLHTAGWLHKGIRSENILVFGSLDDPLSCSERLADIYLCGYEYARADNLLETTEATILHDEALLYKHPLSIGSARAIYQKGFDLYSVGCVLLELGLWASLGTVLLHWVRAPSPMDQTVAPPRMTGEALELSGHSEWASVTANKEVLLRQQGPGSIKAELEYMAGEHYANITMACLQIPDSGTSPDEEAQGDLLKAEQEMLNKLEAMIL
jgi:hypothetical protein